MGVDDDGLPPSSKYSNKGYTNRSDSAATIVMQLPPPPKKQQNDYADTQNLISSIEEKLKQSSALLKA